MKKQSEIKVIMKMDGGILNISSAELSLMNTVDRAEKGLREIDTAFDEMYKDIKISPDPDFLERVSGALKEINRLRKSIEHHIEQFNLINKND